MRTITLFVTKCNTNVNLFPPHREHYSAGPRLTPESWRRWRKRPRTSATTWMLPKAWTPTKTRSITLQTEWPRLCDLYLRNVFYLLCLAVSSCTTPQTLFFFSFTYEPRCGLPLLWLNPGTPVTLLHLQSCAIRQSPGPPCLPLFN